MAAARAAVKVRLTDRERLLVKASPTVTSLSAPNSARHCGDGIVPAYSSPIEAAALLRHQSRSALTGPPIAPAIDTPWGAHAIIACTHLRARARLTLICSELRHHQDRSLLSASGRDRALRPSTVTTSRHCCRLGRCSLEQSTSMVYVAVAKILYQ
jgi:hypothetical protein